MRKTTLTEMKDRYIGKEGTAERDSYEYELKMEVLGKMIKSGSKLLKSDLEILESKNLISHNSYLISPKYSYVATPEEIQENDFNLNIPRYVDIFEEEAKVDIAAVQGEIEVYLKQLMN